MVRLSRNYAPRRRRGTLRLKPLRFVVLVSAVVFAAFFAHGQFIKYTLSKANQHLASSEDEDAARLFQRAASFPFSRGVGRDGLGALALLRGEEAEATRLFSEVLSQGSGRFGADPAVVLDRFISLGHYQRGLLYRDFLLSWRSADDLRTHYLDFATLALGMRELAEARRMLSNVPAADKSNELFRSLQSMADQFEQTFEMPVVMDRQLRPIVVFDVKNSNHLYSVPRLFSGWPQAGDKPGQLLGGLDTRDKLNRIVTTLDLDVQRSAYQAMKGYEGAMVILDVASGDVIAAYGTSGVDPFGFEFEPGSVVKLITYAFFLQQNGRVDGYVPKNYPSSERISGRVFYDWTEHGRIETMEEGMAVSCNLIFAHMGIEMGWPKLRSGLRRFFDDETKPYFFTPARYGKLALDPSDDYQLGRAAIGLDYIRATTLGLAVLPATISNGGVMPNPKLIDRVINLKGAAIRTTEAEKGRKVINADVVEVLTRSMVAALEDPRGTARNIELNQLTLAAKTGTAGDRPYDAIIVGFTPVNQAKIAFAFVLKGGGKAEINGAKVATELMNQLAVQAPAYLGR